MTTHVMALRMTMAPSIVRHVPTAKQDALLCSKLLSLSRRLPQNQVISVCLMIALHIFVFALLLLFRGARFLSMDDVEILPFPWHIHRQ